MCKAVFQLDSVFIYHVGQHKRRGSAFSLHGMNQNFTSVVKCLLDKTVSCSKVLFGVFSLLILDLNVVVIEVLCSRCVGPACYVEYVRDTQIDQLLRFERRLKRSHKNACVNFKQVDLSDCLLALYVTKTLLQMRKPSTN